MSGYTSRKKTKLTIYNHQQQQPQKSDSDDSFQSEQAKNL